MIGIGFPERNDSFDFIAGLEDYKKQLKIVKGTSQPVAKDSGKDYSLKEGEKISINIPGLKKGTPSDTSKPVAAPLIGGGGFKKLAPPPGAKKSNVPAGLGFGAPIS
jgi:hypothetical protein